MAQILVRHLEPRTVKRLKMQARRHGRSLQGEAKAILEAALPLTGPEFAARLAAHDDLYSGRQFSDSTVLVREDRDR